MAVYKSRGIVLRSIRFGEADRILDLYTVDAGLVSVIAKGVRRTKSKFGARLEPLSCVEFMAYQGRNLDTLTQAETLDSFKGVREDLPRFEAAARMVAYVRALSSGGDPDRRIFNLLYHALTALRRRDEGFDVLEVAFGLKLLTISGYALQLDACAGCGEAPVGENGSGKPPRFAPEIGGILCPGCSSEAPKDSFAVPPGTMAAMRRLSGVSLREVLASEGLSEVMTRVLRSHIASHAPAGNLMRSGRLSSGSGGKSRVDVTGRTAS